MSPPVSLYLFILRFLFSCPGVSTCSNRTSGPGFATGCNPHRATRSRRSRSRCPQDPGPSTCPGPALLHGVRDGPPLAAVDSPVTSGSRLSVRLCCGPSLVGGRACRSRDLKLEVRTLLSLSGWSHPLDLCRDLLRFSGPWSQAPRKPGGGPSSPRGNLVRPQEGGGTEGTQRPKDGV